MSIKIQGGTARAGDPPLCHTCRHATIVRGARLSEEIIDCGALRNRRITFPVTFCTDYVHATHPSVHEMEEIAWILRTDPRKRQLGFVQAKTLSYSERHGLDDE